VNWVGTRGPSRSSAVTRKVASSGFPLSPLSWCVCQLTAFDASVLSTKQLELLSETALQLSRVAVLWYEGGNHEAGTVRAAQDAARTLRIQLQAHEVRETADIVGAVAAAKGWGAQALLQPPSPFFFNQRATLVALLTAHRIPAMCESRPLVVQGCLMTYAPSFEAMARRTAYYVDRILKGAKPR
jgi:putative tryptophan/tyrosine transport system substrate-binding protein